MRCVITGGSNNDERVVVVVVGDVVATLGRWRPRRVRNGGRGK